MKIEKGKKVTLSYKLYFGDAEGELVEETQADEPFIYLFGHEPMLEKFDAGLLDKSAGDKFEIKISSDDAYGDHLPERIVKFPKSVFIVDDELHEEALEVGMMVPMADDEGTEIEGMVIENDLNDVTLDFNHPLSGEDLYFDGTVVAIEEPTQTELAEVKEFYEGL